MEWNIIAAWELQDPERQDQNRYYSAPRPYIPHTSVCEWEIRPDTRYYFKWQGRGKTRAKRRHSLGCIKRIITRLIDGIEFNSSR